MAALNCSNCAAPLPAKSGDDVVRCTYCGTPNQVGGLLSRIGLGASSSAVRGGRIAVLAAVAGVVSMGFLVALIVTSSVPEVPQPPAPAAPVKIELPASLFPPPPPAGGVAPAQLATHVGRGWIPVAAPPIEGSLTSFDPVANLPWALDMAKDWAADARLETIYIDGVRADGKLDVSAEKDRHVDYRLFSPSLRASAEAMARVSQGEVLSELRFMVREGGVEALLSTAHGRKEETPIWTPACTLPELMQQAVAQGLGQRLTYSVTLQYVRTYWRWNVNARGIDSKIIKESSCSGAH